MASANTKRIKKIFKDNIKRWIEETLTLSSVTDIVLNNNYQRIVGLGPAALPLIFKELKKGKGYWFWALAAITGYEPSCEEGNFAAYRITWLKWGKEHGYYKQSK